jgi:hypothetical protein
MIVLSSIILVELTGSNLEHVTAELESIITKVNRVLACSLIESLIHIEYESSVINCPANRVWSPALSSEPADDRALLRLHQD